MKQLIAKGIHLVTMMKKNAVAYYPLPNKQAKGRGRPKKYGERVKLFTLFDSHLEWTSIPMPNNEKIIIEYCVVKLLWRPFGDIAQFVFVKRTFRN